MIETTLMRDVRSRLFSGPLLAVVALVPVQTLGQQGSWEEIRSLAESRHEIIMLMIKNQQFDSVSQESEKICQLDFPEEHQHLLAEGMEEIIDSLVHHEQFGVGQEVLDSCSNQVHSAGLLSEFCQLKAYLFKKTGQDDLALEYFKKAIELKEQALKDRK